MIGQGLVLVVWLFVGGGLFLFVSCLLSLTFPLFLLSNNDNSLYAVQ